MSQTQQQKDLRPKVGVGVYIFNSKNEILFLRRQGAHGEGSWCPPGGHLEFGESFVDCARREVFEEVGVKIKNVKFFGLTNDIFDEGKHYITIAMRAEIKSGKVKIMEPDKMTDLGWFHAKKLPKPLFLPVKNFFKAFFVESEIQNDSK